MQQKPTLWLRAELKPKEARTAITPDVAKALVEAGYQVVVEESSQRAIATELYQQKGCQVVAEHTWSSAPRDAIIIGLKELPVESGPFIHRHIHFAHVYKRQKGWQDFLGEFDKGQGTLYDLEYLVDEQGKRVAAFGYWAGYVGAAVALLAYVMQQSSVPMPALVPWESRDQLNSQMKDALQSVSDAPSAVVIGAKGRSGGGAVEFCRSLGLPVLEWDIEETRKGGPFDEALRHSLMINCVFLDKPTAPFTTLAHLHQADRKLSVICDVSCDPFSDANPLPIYQQCTSMDVPCIRIIETDDHNTVPVDLVSIDHLPSLLPVESSTEFSNALLPHLLTLDNLAEGVWQRAGNVFHNKLAEAKSGVNV